MHQNFPQMTAYNLVFVLNLQCDISNSHSTLKPMLRSKYDHLTGRTKYYEGVGQREITVHVVLWYSAIGGKLFNSLQN